MDHDLLCKIVVLGVSSVGKTALVRRLSRDEWIGPNVPSTIGVDFGIVTVVVKPHEIRVKCHIWDTAGQERFAAMSTSYMRGAHAVFYLFDPSDPKSVTGLMEQYLQCKKRESINEDAFEALVGTKIDDEEQEKCKTSDLDTFKMPMYWISSKTGENTTRLLHDACAHFCTTSRNNNDDFLHVGGDDDGLTIPRNTPSNGSCC